MLRLITEVGFGTLEITLVGAPLKQALLGQRKLPFQNTHQWFQTLQTFTEVSLPAVCCSPFETAGSQPGNARSSCYCPSSLLNK